MAEPSSPYRTAEAPPGRLFSLTTASQAPVFAGVIAVALSLMGIAVSSVVLDLTSEHAIPSIAAEVAFAGSLAVTAVWLARGKVTALLVAHDRVDLVSRWGRVLESAPRAGLAVEPVDAPWQTIKFPAIRLAFPSGRTLVVSSWESPLRWGRAVSQQPATHRLRSGLLFPALADALGFASALDHPDTVSNAPKAPAGPPRRAFPLPAVTLPLAVAAAVALGFLFSPVPEPSAECGEASRCCSARLHGAVPVSAEGVRGCMDLLEAEPERCARVVAEARRAGPGSCSLDLLEASTSWPWTEAARAVHEGPPGDDPIEARYPRVSCQEAMARLRQAREAGQPGERIVIRPLQVVIRARSAQDPDGVIYCEGFPLPLASAAYGSREPIVEPTGPHALLVQPLPSGRLAFLSICERCNVTLGEISLRR